MPKSGRLGSVKSEICTILRKNQSYLLNTLSSIETDLFFRLSKKDPKALSDLMKGYFSILSSYASHFVADSSLAKDIVQEVFIKFWQYEGTFDSFGSVKAFLFTLTRNGCLNMQRGRGREADKLLKAPAAGNAEEPAIDDRIVRLEFLAEVNMVVRQMPERMQEIFLLYFEDGLSIEEIAQKLSVSVKTVRNQKYKSLLLLRRQFGGAGIPLAFLIFCTYSAGRVDRIDKKNFDSAWVK